MATIRKKGDYQWHVQIRKRGHPTQTKTFETKIQAEQWAAVIESEIARGVFISRAEAERTTISELIDRYLVEITPFKRADRSEKALAQEKRLLKAVRDEFGYIVLASLQPKHVAAYRDKRQREGKAASTINHVLNTLSSVVNIAVKEWGLNIPSNPVSMVKKPSSGKGRDRRLLEGEETRLLAACELSGDSWGKGTRNPWIKPIVKIALETAMRQGEIVNLRWENITFLRDGRGTAFLEKTKNGESRTVPLSSRAIDVLKGLPRSISGEVFPIDEESTKRTFIRLVRRARQVYEDEIEKQGKEADPAMLVNLHFHDLRHEATSRLAEIFMPQELAKVTGHKTLQMIMRYYHPRAEDLARKLG